MSETSIPGGLDSRAERQALVLAMVDGILYAAMVGLGETYFVADAVRLGASNQVLGLMVGLPFAVGAIGSLLALLLMRVLGRRKPLVVLGTTVQAGVLLGLPQLDRFGAQAPEVLLAAICIYQIFGQAAGTGWSSWYGDLVPSAIRGTYFSRRTRVVHLTTFLSLILGGMLLQQLEPQSAGEAVVQTSGRGFTLIFILAATARLLSTLMLLLSPEPEFRGLPGPGAAVRFLRTRQGASAWRLVLLGSGMSLLVYMGSPFFTPFMLRELKFSYLEFTLASAALVAMKVLVLPAWGMAVDGYSARQVYPLAALMVALVPLPWLWTEGLGWALVAQMYSGLSWGGHEISHFALMLGSSSRKTRPLVFAAFNVLNGAAQLLGSLTGILLVGSGGGSTYRLAFAVSMAGRVLVALAVGWWLPAGPEPRVARGRILMRVIGVRPHGGVVHRPVMERDAPERELTEGPL